MTTISQHGDNADTLAPPRTTRVTPGRTVGGANMTLHTKNAHRLFYGRKHVKEKNLPAIVGLVRFASQSANIHNAVVANDPYADWVLIDIEEALEAVEKLIQTQQVHLNDVLSGYEGIEFSIQESTEPVNIPLVFHSPMAFAASRILVAFDTLVRSALAARQYALIVNDDWNYSVNRCSSAIRGCFEIVNSWKHTGVTRHDIAANNAVARRAAEVYAKNTNRGANIPDDVLQGIRRAKFAPIIQTKDTPETISDDGVEDIETGTTVASGDTTQEDETVVVLPEVETNLD